MVITMRVVCCYSDSQQRLVQLEDTAKAAGKGKWGPPEIVSEHVRDIKWTIENVRHFVDSYHNKPLDGNHLYRQLCCVQPLCTVVLGFCMTW